jgi:hypothetical protein
MMVRFVDIGGIVDHYSLNCLSLFRPGFVNYKKGALDSQPQVIQFTSCLPMVSGFLRVLRLLPSLKLVAMIYIVAEILLKVELKHQQSKSIKSLSHLDMAEKWSTCVDDFMLRSFSGLYLCLFYPLICILLLM